MESRKTFNIKLSKFLNMYKEITLEEFLFIVFIFVLIFLNFENYSIYHIAVGIFSAFIEFAIFIVTNNTYKISKNHFFMLLGIGYFFAGLLDLIYSFLYGDIKIFHYVSSDIFAQFWLVARGFEMATLLISTMYISKKIKKPNYFLIFSVFLAVFTFFVLAFINFHIFPLFGIVVKWFNEFIIVIKYLILLGYCISIFIIYKVRKLIDKSLFLYLEAALIFISIHICYFTLFNSDTQIYVLIGHITKVLSFIFLYKGIIVNGLQRPFDMLTNKLDKADSFLKEKEEQRLYMEEVIVQNEQCYDLLINQSSNGIMIQSEGKIIFVNSTAVEISGAKDVYDFLGKDVLKFIHQDSIVLAMECLKETIRNKTTLPFTEFKYKRLDGEIIDIESSTSYIIYRGKPSFLYMFRDISSEKKIKTLENGIKESELKLHKSDEHNRVLTEFFSNISHELKTPLNVLLGTIQLLQLENSKVLQDSFEKKLINRLIVMKQNTYRLIRIVNNLIDISKYDSGFLNLNIFNYNIVNVLEDITLSVVDYAKSREIELIFDTDVEYKKMAVDADKIERTILNLLSNAIKFTNKGGKIIVSLKDKGENIQISVKDTGIGIPQDKLNLIFDRFEQVDKSLKRNMEGSGIGLSLVKSMVEMHGGSIKVNSKLGEGSEFILDLPVIILEREESNPALIFESKVDRINVEFSDIYSND